MQLSDCKHHHQKLRPDLIWSNASKNLSNLTLGKIAGTQKVGFRFCILHYLRSTWVKKFRAGNIPGISTTNSTVTISVTYAGSSYARQALCLIKSEIKKSETLLVIQNGMGRLEGWAMVVHELLCVKANKPLFTVTTPPIKQLAETFRPCLLQVPQKFRNLRTPYIFTQHNTLHWFVAMVTQSYCTMAGDKEFIIILKR